MQKVFFNKFFCCYKYLANAPFFYIYISKISENKIVLYNNEINHLAFIILHFLSTQLFLSQRGFYFKGIFLF